MRQRYQVLSFCLSAPGLALQFAGFGSETELALLGTLLLLVGMFFYAKSRGRHPAWCLVAWLSCAGFLVLCSLKDLSVPDPSEAARPSRIRRLVLGTLQVVAVLILMASAFVWRTGEPVRRAESVAATLQPGLSLREVCERMKGRVLCLGRRGPQDPKTAKQDQLMMSWTDGHWSIESGENRDYRGYTTQAEFLKAIQERTVQLAAYGDLEFIFLGTTPLRSSIHVHLDARGMVERVSRPASWD